jgi:Tfp pilus assembly protein PilO
MNNTRIWVFGTLVVTLLIAIVAYEFGISPILTQISAASAQTTTIQATNGANESQLASLRTQFAGVNKLRTKLGALRVSVPEQASTSAFINEVTSLGTGTGVTVQSLTIASATVYTAPSAAAGAAATGTTTGSTPAPAPTTTTPVASTPSAASAGLIIIPVTITVLGAFEPVREFVGAVQNGDRLFVSATLSQTTDPTVGLVTATITGDIFSLQGTSDTPTTKTRTPTATATATPTVTATPTSTPKPSSTTSSTTSKSGSTNAGSSSGSSSNSSPVAQPAADQAETPTPASPTS